MGELFFELLKCAIWDHTPYIKSPLNEEEWQQLFSMAKEQTVTGIMLDAIAKLPQELQPQKQLRMQWIIAQKIIEKQNAYMNKELADMITEMESAGIKAYLLKGQGVAAYYPEPSHRVCGDIDLFFKKRDFEKAIEHFISKNCIIEDNSEESHAETTYKNISLELHKKSATFYSKKTQKLYSQIMEKLLNERDEYVEINGCQIPVLPKTANAIQLLAHTQRHIITSGIGLRQVCDWVLFIYRNQKYIEATEFIGILKELQLYKTYKALTYIAIEKLGLPRDYAMCNFKKTDIKNARKMMWLITTFGNFGHYGEHNILQNKADYLKAYIWKVRNCIRFYRLAQREAFSYPVWQLHSVKDTILKRKHE